MEKDIIKIESIKKIKKPGMYELITNVDKLTVSDDIIVKYNLSKDLELTADDYKAIKKDNDKSNIFFKVLNYISYQMRSENEIYIYLEKYDVSKKDAKEIVKRLKDLQFIDDDILASNILDSVIRNNKGPNAFRDKLWERKLKVDVNKYLEKYDTDTESEVIDKVILKNYDKKKNLPIIKQKNSLYAKLIRDGFNSSLIESKINKLEFIDESSKTLDKEIDKLIKKYDKYSGYELQKKITSNLIQKGYNYHDINKKISEKLL